MLTSAALVAMLAILSMFCVLQALLQGDANTVYLQAADDMCNASPVSHRAANEQMMATCYRAISDDRGHAVARRFHRTMVGG